MKRLSPFITYALLALSFLVLVAMAYTSVNSNRKLMIYSDKVEHTYLVLKTIKQVEKLMIDGETAQRGYLLTNKENFRIPYTQFLGSIDSAMNMLDSLVQDDPAQRVEAKLLRRTANARRMFLDSGFMSHTRSQGFLTSMVEGKLHMDKFRVYANNMETRELSLLGIYKKEKEKTQRLTPQLIRYSFILAILISVISIILIAFQHRRRMRYQAELEKSVLELKRSNEEVEQMAFAVSHDLQEPLRKISIFTNLFTNKYSERFSEEERSLLQRMDKSTKAMQLLLQDLVSYTTLLNKPEKLGQVNLNKVVEDSFDMVAAEQDHYNWYFNHDLPPVNGYPQQLKMLFTEIFENSFKYRRKNQRLVIQISHMIVSQKDIREAAGSAVIGKQFLQVCVSDNGIGIENAFAEKMFVIFQRLHQKDEYSGKGIGLAIAKRVIANHYGFIEASGKPDQGCTIYIYLPL
ncbi:sensor histidine kinase [Sediminibacterium ginsengisoli]|nr:sensor histidine kinase [Sediminibacterium ginsengisoli]